MRQKAKLVGICAFVGLATMVSSVLWVGLIWLAWDVRLRDVIAAALAIAIGVACYKKAQGMFHRRGTGSAAFPIGSERLR